MDALTSSLKNRDTLESTQNQKSEPDFYLKRIERLGKKMDAVISDLEISPEYLKYKNIKKNFC